MLLLVTGAEIPVEIQPALAYSHASWMLRQLPQVAARLSVPLLGIVGVHLDKQTESADCST